MMHKRLLGITMGDPAGIGPELIVKLLYKGVSVPFVVYGDEQSLYRAAAFSGLPCPFIYHCQSPEEASAVLLDASEQFIIPLINAGIDLGQDFVLGQTSREGGEASYAFLNKAIDHALSGEIDAIVTAPLHKVSLKLAGYHFPGHTEILAYRAGVDHVGMMLLNDEIRVILVTIHMALADVPHYITPENEAIAIRLAHKACQQLGLVQGRIAVAGLNPHAGEEGRFGREEIEVIKPTIEALQAEGILVSGPYPGDTIFMRARQGEFDIVVAQYHDQGLIPVKYLGVDSGVNVTVGLPFIRTSVDHGTAFDIAGKGMADESSLREAFMLAVKMLGSA
ncbi:4-hydroxythreonine-4-phosphate dehydrogenase PdxA [Pelistega ratti]|uniref:4-hydroxythreonine-4-phosphate dehydrogenase PdxA n=1 Tax=Pelistega ratti TaxID=2652177 RepID=UPI003C6DB8E4